ncbi:MAG: hypothetical protein Q9166_005970 [cf. Caloplaca sp. 2 TL-2023]
MEVERQRLLTLLGESNIGSVSSSSKNSNEVGYLTVTWSITDNLSLTINVGPWQLSPERILEALAAADTAIGKKPAARLLDGKFVQKTGSRINTLLFEIGPGFIDPKRLTWADVAQVLGENGLPKFFREEGYWVSTYFDVEDTRKGKLGEGVVRKWYQLELPGEGKS